MPGARRTRLGRDILSLMSVSGTLDISAPPAHSTSAVRQTPDLACVMFSWMKRPGIRDCYIYYSMPGLD